MGKSPHPDRVDEAVGNKSWTVVPKCDECDAETDKVVEIGEEPNYGNITVCLCLDCLKKALKIMEGT